MLGSDNKRCGIVAEALIETAGLGQPGLFLAGYVFIYGKQNENGYTSPRYTQKRGVFEKVNLPQNINPYTFWLFNIAMV